MIGKFKKRILNSNGNYEVTFEISSYGNKIKAESLVNDKEYNIEEAKSSRTLQQNKFMWECLEIIAKHELGGRTDSDYVMELYTKMLEKSGAKYEYMMALPETKEELLKVFRAIRTIEYREYNNKKMAVMKCFYGSSKMNTKEMTNLINTIKDYAAELDIYINEEELYYDIRND